MSPGRDWFRDRLREVGAFQLDRQQSIHPASSDLKGRVDLVTEVDRESERRLVTALNERFPEDGILAEEEVKQESENGRRWIIDPLDGTTNYVHHHPFFGISVGLQDQGTLTEGYVYFPRMEEFFHAQRGSGAFKNGEAIHVSSIEDPMDALLATGFADLRTEESQYNLPVFNDLIQRVQGVRRAGSAVHDLCMLAEGVFEGFWEFNLQPWDVAAGAVIVREAGGRITDMTGGDDWLRGEHIVASNGGMHPSLLDWLRPHLPDGLRPEPPG